MDGGLLSLRWNDHGQTFFSMLSSVRKRGAYTDVTLACDGRFYPAHRLVLSTCSDFFDQMFERTTCKHPVIVVANVSYGDLEALLNYMYLGEINVLQADLSALMKAAEALRIKGLAEPTSSAPSEPELKEGKRLHEDEAVGNKRKKLDEAPPTRQLPTSKPATSKPTTSKPIASKPTTSNAEETTCSQPDSSSRSRPNSQAPAGGGWVRVKGGVRPGEPPASSTGGQGKQTTAETDAVATVFDTDHDHTPNPPSSEVKMEEVSVKDEPTSWYPENDSEPVKYPDPNASLEYSSGDTAAAAAAAAAVDYQGGGGSTAWNVLQTQLESHLLHGQPGTSTMAGERHTCWRADRPAHHPGIDHTLIELPKGKHRYCANGHPKRIRSCWECSHCNVGLCFGCMYDYHRKLRLSLS